MIQLIFQTADQLPDPKESRRKYENDLRLQVIFFDEIYPSIYIKMGVQMFFFLLVCGELMEIQTPVPIWMKFCTQILTCPRKVLVQV